MPTYFYKAVATGGDIMEGEIEAPSQNLAIERLQLSGYLPISAEEINNKQPRKFDFFHHWLNKDRIKHSQLIHLTRELATLMNAGLPLDQSLQSLETLNNQPAMKKLIQDVQTRVQGGAMLSDALEAQGRVFSPLYISMIRAGEAGGALDTIFLRLTDFMERSQELRATTISALIYPCILLVVASLSVFALLLFVVPQFIPLFEDAGKALPLSTQIVFGTAELLRQFWWIPLTLFIVAALYFDQQLKLSEKRLAWDKWCLRIPLLGDLLSKLDITRFARTLGTLLTNGVPLLQSIKIVQDVLTNKALALSAEHAYEGLERGEKLATMLKEDGEFPELSIQLIQVGEDSGQLEAMLLKIADIYQDETRRTIQRMLALMEPILILGLGAVIAFIIISILMAMLGLNELVI